MLRHYLTLAFRALRRNPLASLVSVLTLAVGLACFLTAYAFAAFFERAEHGFEKADRTYVLTSSFTFFGGTYRRDQSTGTPEHVAELLRTDFPAIERIARAAVLDPFTQTSVSTGDRALRLFAVAADAAFLDIFDLPFVSGDPRTALRRPGSAVLTRDAAARLFGDEDPIGRSVRLDDRTDVTVTGVIDAVPEPSHMGRSPSASLRFDVLASFDVREALQGNLLTVGPGSAAGEANWTAESVVTYLLLPADGSLSAEALADGLEPFATRHVPAETLASSGLEFGLIPVPDLLRRSVDTELLSGDIGISVSTVLLALGALVLVVACVNYANLATARAAGRMTEVGVRKALGARPLQIVQQHLSEAALAAAVALLLAYVLVRAAMPVLTTLSGMDLGAGALSGTRAAAFFAAVFLAVTVGAGAYPAFVLSRVGAAASIRPSGGRVGPKRLASLLVGAQFAVASVLLIAVTITWQQNAKLERIGLRQADSRLLLLENESRTTGVDGATLGSELLRLPQVEAVTEMSGVPWQRLVALTRLTRSPDASAGMRPVLVRSVGSDFFSVMGIDVLAGRTFSPGRGDDTPPAGPAAATPARPQSIVVDRAFVEEFGFGSPAEAVDRLVYSPGMPGRTGPRPNRIIGVVETRPFSYRGAGAVSTVYMLGSDLGVTVARVAGNDIGGALEAIDGLWRRLAPDSALRRRFLDDVFNQAYETFVRINQAFVGLALTAFFIAAAGLFGIGDLVAARRRPEIGVRKTFGASTRQMVVMLLRSFSKPVIVANIAVWPLAYLAARAYLGAFLDPAALTPAPFVGSLTVTLLIAWIAIGGQTWRAARTAPAEVLRHE